MNVNEIVEKLLQLQSLLQEVLPAARALQARANSTAANLGRAMASVRKYSTADVAKWRAMAASPDLNGCSKRNAARIIVRREGRPSAAIETVRRVI